MLHIYDSQSWKLSASPRIRPRQSALPCKVIQIIAEISLRFIRTCTVQHDKPEAHEEYDDEQHVIIKILYLAAVFSAV